MTALTGIFAAILHFAGALKSTPLLAALPVDLTTVAALGLLAALALLAAGCHWRMDPLLGLPLAACGALWLWLVLAGAWSPSRGILAAKLPDVVLLGPAMLLAGMAVAAQTRALARSPRPKRCSISRARSRAWVLPTRCSINPKATLSATFRCGNSAKS